MQMSKNNISIINNIKYEIRRYTNTINLILLCKNFIEKKNKDLQFYPPEENFYTNYQKDPVTPDFSILKNNKLNGIVCEVKAGLPEKEEHLTVKIDEKLKKYLNLVQGWDLTKSDFSKIKYSLLFIAYEQRIENLRTYLISKNKKQSFKKKVSVWEFATISDQYSNDLRFYRLRHYYGESCIKELDYQANIGFKMLINDLDRERERCLFTIEPPLEYIILVLWTFILSYISSKKGVEFIITVDEIHKLIEENYMNWGGSKKLLRRYWIVNALNKMVEFNLITKGKKNDTFNVKFVRIGRKELLTKIEEKIIKNLQKIEKPKIKKKTLKPTRQTILFENKKASVKSRK